MTIRNGDLATIHATAMTARQSFVDVVASEALYDPAGIIDIPNGDAYRVAAPTAKAHRHLASRADIPQKFYDRIRASHPELWAHTLGELSPKVPTLYRTISQGDDAPAVLRAVRSDRFGLIDNVDVTTTLLAAFTAAGLGANDLEITGDFDAEDGYLRLRCTVPAIAVNALELVRNYRDPRTGRSGVDYPMVYAGIEVGNSEVGDGAYYIRQRALLQVCRNGMTAEATGDQFRKIHLGARLGEGVIAWSDETRQRQLELIGSAAGDAIRTFISPGYLRRIVDEASVAAGVAVADTSAAMAQVVTTCSLSDDEARAVLDAFVRSADMSVLGLAQAVTAVAQDVPDGERQSDLEQAFWAIVNNAEAHTGA